MSNKHELTSYTVKIETSISPRIIADAISGAFNGGSTYWIESVERIDGVIHIKPYEYDGVCLPLSRENITKGLQTMYEKYPRHYINLTTGNDDATTHDVFLQCVTFGELIFS